MAMLGNKIKIQIFCEERVSKTNIKYLSLKDFISTHGKSTVGDKAKKKLSKTVEKLI